MNLEIAMITAPRPRPTVGDSIAQLRRAGFAQTVRLFAEPDAPALDLPNVQVRRNARRLGLWPNWLNAATNLWAGSAASTTHFLLCEDDILLCRGAADALQRAARELPANDWGYASLYTPLHNVPPNAPHRDGWQAFDLGSRAWGALAWCFTRDSLRKLLNARTILLHARRDGTDAVVTKALAEIGLKTWFHLPSLGDHAGGGNSASGHGYSLDMAGVRFDPEYKTEANRPRRKNQLRPRVACVMITGNRREFALKSVAYFQRQDYAERELVIYDDGRDGLQELLPNDPRIRYHRGPAGLSVGERRNRAVALTRCPIVVHWDDDDWYSPRRLSYQVEPIVAGRADVTALGETRFFDLRGWKLWKCSPALHAQLFFGDVHGGTLAYRRELWADCGGFPHAWLAEDAAFLRAALARDARLVSLPSDEHFLYVRHEGNAWNLACGDRAATSGWQPLGPPRLARSDREFYRRRHRLLNAR